MRTVLPKTRFGGETRLQCPPWTPESTTTFGHCFSIRQQDLSDGLPGVIFELFSSAKFAYKKIHLKWPTVGKQ